MERLRCCCRTARHQDFLEWIYSIHSVGWIHQKQADVEWPADHIGKWMILVIRLHHHVTVAFKWWSSKNQYLSNYSDREPSELLEITCNLLKSRVQGAIGFGFASHWQKNWREIFKPITERSSRDRVISFGCHLKGAQLIVLLLVSVVFKISRRKCTVLIGKRPIKHYQQYKVNGNDKTRNLEVPQKVT